MTSEIRLLTRVTVAKAKSVVTNPDEPGDSERGGWFVEWAMLTLHALRIELGKSYRSTVNLLSEMTGVLDEIGLLLAPLYGSTHVIWANFDYGWHAFLGASAEKRTSHAAIDSTSSDRDQSRHYANRTNYRVRALKVTALVDVETLYITDIHTTTSKKHGAKSFRDELRGNGIRPLIKQRIMSPLDHAHNARMDSNRNHQLSMSETVFSSIKRTLGSAVGARSWMVRVPRNATETGRLQPSSERPISVKSTAVYRNYKAE